MSQSVQQLVGVGPRTAEQLNKLNIFTLQDLLFHLPIRYQDRTQIIPINDLNVGDNRQIQGKIQQTNINYGKRRSLIVKLADTSGEIGLRFFHFSNQQKDRLKPNTTLKCFGSVIKVKNRLEMMHPEYCVVDEHDVLIVDEVLTPVYSVTKGLKQKKLRGLIQQALDLLQKDITIAADLIPREVGDIVQVPDLITALDTLHRPAADISNLTLEQWQHPAQKRLAFEELLAYHLRLQKIRNEFLSSAAFEIDENLHAISSLVSHLPFPLTHAQSRVINEISHDLNKKTPMNRLLQGDVGSGKTIIAVLAVLQVVKSGYQAAVLAPTELLAEQHLRSFKARFEPFKISVAFLSAGQSAHKKREVIQGLSSGRIQVVIGTHAVFQKGVEFKKLALCVVDEQHRFGVSQRLMLKQKGQIKGLIPHQLVMTATPIPRTMAMLFYADLDFSILDELPPGRQVIETISIPDTRRNELIQRVNHVCGKSRQVYWVCPFIDESENSSGQAVLSTYTELCRVLPQKRIGLIHGKMKAEQKYAVMRAFLHAELDILVATTVIEVGVDVANACLMVIENSERLGMAQLHQLRGRVGRSDIPSCCILMYRAPLQDNARRRLAILRGSSNGFEIAKKDMEMRGPGEFLGTRQAGMVNLKIADVQRDHKLIPHVFKMAKLLLERYPDLAEDLIRRWVKETRDYTMV